MPDFRRGRAAMEESAKDAESRGSFRPFAPSIDWKEGEDRYVAFLNDIDDIPKVLLHRFIPLETYEKQDGSEGTRYGFYISRKDPAIGEDFDLLEDELEKAPSERYLAVAVELEPVYDEGRTRGKHRPVGFEVKTDTYERRIDPEDEDSELEEVDYPVVGLVDKAWGNYFNSLSAHAAKDGPIQECGFRVERLDGDTTTYRFTPFFDQEIDYSNLFEYIDGISYLSDDEDDFNELIENLEKAAEAAESANGDTQQAQALVIGNALLDRRLEELSDKNRYEAEVGDLTVEDVETKWDRARKKEKAKKKSGGKSETKKRTTARRSQRSRAKSKDDEAETQEESTDEAEAEEEKPKAKAKRSRAKSKTSSGGASKSKFDAVKKRAAEKRKAKAEAEDTDDDE